MGVRDKGALAPVVAWISRHPPLAIQVGALRCLYPGAEFRQDVRPFGSAEEILGRVRAMGATDCVVVAPLSVLGRLCDLGLRPLWAEMEVVGTGEPCDVEAAGRRYVFRRFRRVRRLVLEFDEAQPLTPPSAPG